MVAKKKFKKDIKIDNIEDVDLNEITDSDNELSETDQELLQQARVNQAPENFDSDDEVYKLQNESDEDEDDNQHVDSMESDIEGFEEDFDVPDQRAWGKKKKLYYSTDFVDPDYASVSQKDLANAEIEEQEARSIQKRLAEQLDDADFGLEFVQIKDDEIKEQKDESEIVKTDLTKLSKRQKQALMQKESPEFMALVNDFKDCMKEARDILLPFLHLVKKGVCPDCPASSFVKAKYHLILNYCINISFYLMLKARRLPVNSHPVIKRLAQYRKLLTELQSGQGDLLEKIKEIITTEKQGGKLYNISDSSLIQSNKKVQNKIGKVRNHRELNEKVKCANNVKRNSMEDEEDIDEDGESDEEISNIEDNKVETKELEQTNELEGRRAITYQIAKNKGLTPHRKKEQRNPRVKHRNKYRKAKIRRKGAVREVRKEITRYAGEISGIKAGVKKSIKIK